MLAVLVAEVGFLPIRKGWSPRRTRLRQPRTPCLFSYTPFPLGRVGWPLPYTEFQPGVYKRSREGRRSLFFTHLSERFVYESSSPTVLGVDLRGLWLPIHRSAIKECIPKRFCV